MFSFRFCFPFSRPQSEPRESHLGAGLWWPKSCGAAPGEPGEGQGNGELFGGEEAFRGYLDLFGILKGGKYEIDLESKVAKCL